jgi:hypothetical protein
LRPELPEPDEKTEMNRSFASFGHVAGKGVKSGKKTPLVVNRIVTIALKLPSILLVQFSEARVYFLETRIHAAAQVVHGFFHPGLEFFAAFLLFGNRGILFQTETPFFLRISSQVMNEW